MELRKIKDWCYIQIGLMNRLRAISDFPGEVVFCGRSSGLSQVHIHSGIEIISSALKLPVKIEVGSDGWYEKSVTHLGIKFFQIEKCVA